MATTGGFSWATTPGWVKMLLIASVALNMGVAGLVGGTAMRDHGGAGYSGKDATESGFDRRQRRILDMVPEARREDAKAVLVARSDEYSLAQAALKQAQMDLVDSIRSEPFDPDQVWAAISARSDASGRVWGLGYEQLAEIVVSLESAERAELADRLEERTKRWMERQGGKSK